MNTPALYHNDKGWIVCEMHKPGGFGLWIPVDQQFLDSYRKAGNTPICDYCWD